MGNNSKNIDFIRVAAVSPEMRVADVEFNLNEIKNQIIIAEKKSADFILFPELCICGYTCADLFFQNKLITACSEALIELSRMSKSYKSNIILGLPLVIEGKLYNSAAVISNGEILGIVPKTYLCNYSEYYEERWFSSAFDTTSDSIEINGKAVPFGADLIFKCKNVKDLSFGIEICEDLWAVKSPSLDLAVAGANLIFNPSSSNDYLSKSDFRRDLVKMQSAKCIASYIYTSSNANESTTDNVFSGHSLICENGKLLVESQRFQFDSQIIFHDIDIEILNHDRIQNKTFSKSRIQKTYRQIDFSLNKKRANDVIRHFNPHPFIPEEKSIIDKVCKEITEIQSTALAKRLLHTQMKNVVIGISGGLDSTLALLSTIKAFEKLKLNLKGIHALTMPGFGTSNRTFQNAVDLINELKVSFKEISITKSVGQHFIDIGQDIENHDVVYENSQARMRTMILMDYANKMNGIVIGTGDLSELALGWATYNGDHMSMYGLNAGIPKTLVKYIIEWYAYSVFNGTISELLNDIIQTPISPELLPLDRNGEISQETEDLIGKYELHDFVLFHFIRYGFSPEKILKISKLAFRGKYSVKEIKTSLDIFIKRFFYNQFKRSAMPDSIKVGSVALSPRSDWRMPSDASPNLWI